MSCGPAQAILDVADQIENAKEAVLAEIDASPLGQLLSIKEEAEAELNGLMDKLESAIPEMATDLAEKAFDELPLSDQMKDIAGFIALGYLQKDLVESKLESVKNKFGAIVDANSIDDVVSLLRSGAASVDDLCKLIPNVDTQGIGFAIKGIPTSFPTLDPVAMIKKGKLPDLPDVGKVFLEAKVEAKDQADDFLSLELPRFDL